MTGKIVAGFVAGLFAVQAAPAPPKVGTLVSGTAARRVENGQVMAGASLTWPAYELTSEGVPFTLGVDDGGVIRYVKTSDVRFATPEGIRVGSKFQEVAAAAAMGGRRPRAEAGWTDYVELPSGWSAAFMGPALNQGDLMPETPVKYLFQRISFGAPPGSSPSTRSEEVTLRAVIESFEPAAGSDLRDRNKWVVHARVLDVLHGSYSSPEFEFRVHSPARAGLEAGATRTIKAKWTGGYYVADESQ
jgi:hypothetical protein